MKYSSRRSWKKVTSSWVTIAILLIVCVFVGRASWGVYGKARVVSDKISKTENEISKIDAHKDELNTKLAYLSTPEGIEAEIRSKYRAVKEGESVAVIVSDKTSVSTTTSTVATTSSWWSRFLQTLGF